MKAITRQGLGGVISFVGTIGIFASVIIGGKIVACCSVLTVLFGFFVAITGSD
jgi:hypothetical protein